MENYVVELYNHVLNEMVKRFSVKDDDIRRAIQHIKDAYLPDGYWEIRENVQVIANYNDAAHQCAYLHKHAVCYTGMVNHFMRIALRDSNILQRSLGEKAIVNVCSIGGGPGTDVIAILEAFVQYFSLCHIDISVIDYFRNWENVFTSVISELRTGRYGSIRESVLPQNFNYEYIQADLLEPFSPSVKQAIRNSDFVSMVKFVSAAACCKTEKMVKEIFNCMHPGAYLLFIDNAAGGFLERIQTMARDYGLETAFGPIAHEEYSNSAYSSSRYGALSQSRTRVSLQIWMKPLGQLKPEIKPLAVHESLHSTQNSVEIDIESLEPVRRSVWERWCTII